MRASSSTRSPAQGPGINQPPRGGGPPGRGQKTAVSVACPPPLVQSGRAPQSGTICDFVMGPLSNCPVRRQIRAQVNTSFFGDMLQSIAERGRALVERTRDRREVAEQRSAGLIQLCEDLLSRRGEASGVAIAREILARYGALKTGPRIAFFH